ncbi:MAG: hypothetical protein HKM23_08140 [Nitrosopumilus sp.]|nr:hypothetical protein [Nitrosopumilus sp.]
MKSYQPIFNLPFGICAATVKTILRQKKKEVLLEFLFGSHFSQATDARLENKIQILETLVASLQERVIQKSRK